MTNYENPGGTNPSNEKAENLGDNNRNSKWLDFNMARCGMTNFLFFLYFYFCVFC